MLLIINLSIIIIGLTIMAWNAYVILWGVHKNIPNFNKKRKHWSRVWHGLGWVLRFELGLLFLYLLIYGVTPFYSLGNLLFTGGVFLFIMMLFYDLGINIIRDAESPTTAPKIWYIDNKGINRIMLKILKYNWLVWAVKLMLPIGLIIIGIILN